jgi:hypothetical protein
MAFDNTDTRRSYLLREWANLNEAIEETRQRTAAYTDQKARVVRELRATGMGVPEIARALEPPLTRQAVYSVLARSDKRIHEEADGSWSFYCPHKVGESDPQRFPSEAMARQYADAHDRAIHGDLPLAQVYKSEVVR